MTQHRKQIIIGAVSLGILAAGLFVVRLQVPAVARVATVSSVTATITIDPQAGETFAAAPPSAVPTLTAQEAWAQYTQVDTSYSSTSIPSNVTAQLGLLTLPTGPTGPNGSETYAAQNELVYGYSWHNCPVSRAPWAVTPPPNPCVEWNFLDANTGAQIDETWQMQATPGATKRVSH